MAKISAYGEHEVARVEATTNKGNHRYVYVMTSGGRVLVKYLGLANEPYTLFRNHINPQDRNEAFLCTLLEARHMKDIKGRTPVSK
jgi:hypothetical protein